MLYLPPCRGQTALPAGYDPAHKFSQQELRQDFALLRQVLEESHPGLYRFTPTKEMDADFERAFQSIQTAMDEREFYGVVTSLLSQIKDGHTRAYLAPDFRKFLDSSAKRIPLRVRMLDHKLYVLASADDRVPPGSELMSIQGMPVTQITEAMFNHISGDGDILTAKAAAIGNNFWLYYYLFLGQPETLTWSTGHRINRKRSHCSWGLRWKQRRSSGNPRMLGRRSPCAMKRSPCHALRD
jgi:hypothetical protein